jgi:predicted DNA-binding antitoxin AbrB/MazE fold protein
MWHEQVDPEEGENPHSGGTADMARKKPIVAIYEDGSFKPLEPVSDVAEHERVYLMIETEKTLEDRIAESERLARESFEGLTDEQLLILVRFQILFVE